MKLLYILFTISFFTHSCISTGRSNSYRLDELSAQIDSIAEVTEFNGVVLLAKKNSVIYHKAFGLSDIDKQVKLHTLDQFYIGSISKQITAVLILREYEVGNLKLEDSLAKFLPKLKQSWAHQVTIHHLLTHTHGIVNVNEPLEFGVGEQFNYSQLGYGLLAQILEKIQGKAFEDIANELFAEFDMHHTLHPSKRNAALLALGYEEVEQGEMVLAEGNPVQYIAAGGFISNAQDLLRWNLYLHKNRILKPETYALMTKNHATRNHPIFGEIDYGYGLLFNKGEQERQIGALGYAPGFASANYFFPQSEITLIVLSNMARNLDDFKLTFEMHLRLIDLVKEL